MTLVGKGDAKSRHSEILIVAAVTGPELNSRVGDRGSVGNHGAEGNERIVALLGNEVKSIRMVFLTKDEVPGEVRHQADVAGDPELQARTDLTQRP